MKSKLNTLSFISSFICILIFLLAAFSLKLHNFFINIFNLNPFILLLILSIVTFFIGVFGFLGISNWQTLFKSIFTLITTFTIFFISLLLISMATMSNFL